MHAIAGMFYARASVTPKRVLRSLCTQKVLTQMHAGIPLHSQDACNAAPSTARVAL